MEGTSLTANRIRDLRVARSLTQEELAALIGDETTIATISRLENGRMTLTLPWVDRIAAAIGVSPHEVIARPEQGLRMVPLIGEVSAGSWQLAVHDPISWVPVVDRVGGPNTFALKPKGDSMNKIADEDSYIVVDPDQVSLEDNKIYCVGNGDNATFKLYRSDPPRLEPMSTNPVHQPIMVGAEPFVVIGRVTYIGREL